CRDSFGRRLRPRSSHVRWRQPDLPGASRSLSPARRLAATSLSARCVRGHGRHRSKAAPRLIVGTRRTQVASAVAPAAASLAYRGMRLAVKRTRPLLLVDGVIPGLSPAMSGNYLDAPSANMLFSAGGGDLHAK